MADKRDVKKISSGLKGMRFMQRGGVKEESEDTKDQPLQRWVAPVKGVGRWAFRL